MLPLILSLLVSSADAKSNGPYMWGVGPSLGTIAYPGRFPPALPNDDDGDNVSGIDKAAGDVQFGVRGVAYLDKEWRGGARALAGWGVGKNGNGFRQQAITLEVDKILVGQNSMYAFGGAGLGFGKMHLASDDSSATVDLSTYLVRGQLGAYYRMKKSAVEVNFFAVFVWPGVQTYTGGSGNESEISGGNYLNGGLEGTVYFGDFKPPKKKNKNKNKSSSSKSSSKSGKSSGAKMKKK